MASWESGMKVDPVALCSLGVYSETYGASEQQNICNLFGSLGFIEDAAEGAGFLWAHCSMWPVLLME